MKSITTLVTLLVLTVVFLTGCGISQDKYDAAISEASDLNIQLSNLQADLTTTQANLATAQADLATTQANLATAQQNLNTVIEDRDLIQEQLDDTEADLTTAQDQLEAVNPLITTLQSENEQLREITGLSLHLTKAEAVTVHQTNGVYSNIVSFTADYAGYVVVSGTSTSVNGYIYVEDTFNGYPYKDYLHYFVTGTTLKIPVLPGTVSVFFTNTDPIGATAVLTVVYYY